MYEIYVITNTVNGKKYVGQTSRGFEKRWKGHLSTSRGDRQLYFLNAIRKHGAEAFTHEIVAEVASREEANSLERLWIQQLNTMDPSIGYNSTQGGEGFSSGDLNPNRLNPRSGNQIWNFGKSTTPEVRAKISKTLTGMLVGDKNPFYGRKHTEETKQRIGDIQRGQIREPRSEATREKIRQRMLNRVFSPETLEKMAEAKRGKKLSPEHRQKLSEAQQVRRAREAKQQPPLPVQENQCPTSQ